jgi:hypothetical protein
MSSAVSCPVCSGPIGIHVVRSEFTRHHCSWAVRANVGTAFVRGVVVGVVGALASLGLALLLPYPTWSAVTAWLQFGGFVGLAVGAAAYRAALVLTPLRPQRTLQPSGAPTLPAQP